MRLEVLWRQLVETGSEHLILSMEDGIHADSLSVGEIGSAAYRIHYEIDCDPKWNVQRLRTEDLLTGKTVALARADNNLWSDGAGHALEALDGCSDLDIMITPFTNTLPIRRLKWRAGQARDMAVVYVGLPDLTVSRLEQRYTCIARDDDGGVYRYENINSGFKADLKVDSDGLVMDYPDIFVMDAKRRLASS